MEDDFVLLNLGITKQSEGRELLFVSIQASSVRLIKECSGNFVEGIFVECGRLMVVFDKRTSRPNHGEDVIFRRNVDVWINGVRDANICCQRSSLPSFR